MINSPKVAGLLSKDCRSHCAECSINGFMFQGIHAFPSVRYRSIASYMKGIEVIHKMTSYIYYLVVK